MRTLCFALLLLAGHLFAAPTHSRAGPAATMKQLPKDSWMFLVKSNFAEVEQHIKGVYTLRLENVDPNVVYFTNPKQPNAGMMQLPDFVRDWSAADQKTGLPNVVHAYLNSAMSKGHKSELLSVLKVMSPQYDHASNTITFDVDTLPGYSLSSGIYKDTVIIFDCGNFCEGVSK